MWRAAKMGRLTRYCSSRRDRAPSAFQRCPPVGRVRVSMSCEHRIGGEKLVRIDAHARGERFTGVTPPSPCPGGPACGGCCWSIVSLLVFSFRAPREGAEVKIRNGWPAVTPAKEDRRQTVSK